MGWLILTAALVVVLHVVLGLSWAMTFIVAVPVLGLLGWAKPQIDEMPDPNDPSTVYGTPPGYKG